MWIWPSESQNCRLHNFILCWGWWITCWLKRLRVVGLAIPTIFIEIGFDNVRKDIKGKKVKYLNWSWNTDNDVVMHEGSGVWAYRGTQPGGDCCTLIMLQAVFKQKVTDCNPTLTELQQFNIRDVQTKSQTDWYCALSNTSKWSSVLYTVQYLFIEIRALPLYLELN